MLKKAEKRELVKQLGQELAEVKGIFFAGYQGLPTRDLQSLRAELRRQEANYKVVKISLLKRALSDLGLDTAGFNFTVPLAVAYTKEDEMVPAKILQKFAKKNENFKILAGYVDKKFMDAAAVKQFAALPGKAELRSQLVNVIAAPLSGFANVLVGNIRGLINIFNAKIKMQNDN